MGHDITAMPSTTDNAEVAYLRRAAGNPLNQVIYLVLGVMDEAYAGCSGNGTDLRITLEQLRGGLLTLDVKSFAGMTRERNMIDTICVMLGGDEASKIVDGEADITPERRFLEKCIAFCETNGVDSLVVSFS